MKRHDLLLLLVGLGVASCTEATLTPAPEKSEVNLQYDWKGAAAPKKMKAYFYPTESTTETSGLPVFGEGTAASVSVQLPEGTYRVLTFNSDVTGVSFTDMNSYQTATVSAERVPTRAGSTMVAQPSDFYSCGLDDEVTASVLDPLSISASPRQLTRTLKLEIKLSDISGVDALEGSLCGIYPSLSLATGLPDPASVASAPSVRSAFRVDNPSANVTNYFRTLGILNPKDGDVYRSIMELALTGNDGWRQEVSVDLTDVLTDVIDNNNNDLPIEVPVEIALEIKPVGTSLQATVKSWSQGNGDGYIYE